MRPDDPAVVREEYASEARLAVRKAAHALAVGSDAREVLFEAVAEAAPRRILDVGCGEGELAERLARERLPSSFTAENGERISRRHFDRVERRGAAGWIVFPDTASAQTYIDSLVLLEGTCVPSTDGPIRARRTPAIFIAER